MEDSDVCPLCCEELDISDRQFFPCKCGYQVCMWCWHRIRESESGLCPACRTPYGDDPHEFSAVDMEEVLKANKAKAAAEKRERERLKQDAAASNLENTLENLPVGPMALPKDRNSLANMRVIRRNLVYAVGLPPTMASEEMLRRPEYFGQYGKINKIVLNRNNTTTADPRRASASAYVTFFHKEDTLACILALDGFYIDGRNVRASYGTSKYCSAFIKNVRCNNPECTYLHCMGDAEDTFTKQEIQAGYVTSGRDVLARQQQIVAQALNAAAGGASGAGTRRKVGGGGPSGTGKASSNPVFPPPSFDEAIKSSSLSRSNSGTAFPSSTAGTATNAASGQKLVRSMSLGASPPSSAIAAAPKGAIGSTVGSTALPTLGKGAIGSATTASAGGIAAAGASPVAVSGSVIGGASAPTATAASVVAGVRNPTSAAAAEPPASHTTLTPLTKLKRSTTMPTKSAAPGAVVKSNSADSPEVQLPPNMPFPKGLTAEQREALLEQRRESMAAMAKQQREMALKLAALRNNVQKQNGGANFTAPTSPSSSVASSTNGPPIPSSKLPAAHNSISGSGSIGGTVIGGGSSAASATPIGAGAIGGGGFSSGPSSLGGQPIGELSSGPAIASTLGGEVYTGHRASSSSAIGSGSDKWNSQQPSSSSGGLFGNSSAFSSGGGGIWGGESGGASSSLAPGSSALGVDGGFSAGTIGQSASHGVIGGGGSSKHVGTIGGSSIGFGSNQGGGFNSGSSALASMLGINLPTGSGSLRESSSLWESSTPAQPPIGHSSGHAPGVIGSGAGVIGSKASSTPIGGYAIGGGGGSRGLSHSGGLVSNPSGGGSNNSDIALLQSLLPGVHITSGNAQQPAAPGGGGGFGAVGGGWDSNQGGGGGGGGFFPQGESNSNTWGGRGSGGLQPTPVGANSSQQNQKQNQSSSIW